MKGNEQIEGGKGLDAFQAMLWKYTARCALPEGKSLQAPPGRNGKRLTFPGLFGAAPEWNDGPCDVACQEKVSACLIALTNRTGKHVTVSLLSLDPAMGKQAAPSEEDLGFPHQEGTFFGNVFQNQAYACQGSAVGKGPQVKRFCALEPPTCSGLPDFTDIGGCAEACTSVCSRLSDGSERCVARSCRDPSGRQWDHPITVYMRNQIEANNADSLKGIAVHDSWIDGLDDGDRATYRRIDLGAAQGAETFFATLTQCHPPGRIEIWLEGGPRLGVLDLGGAKAGPGDVLSTPLDTAGVKGLHDITLKFVGGKKMGRLSLIEFR